MTIRGGNVDRGLTHWVRGLQGCIFQTLPPRLALFWPCRDRVPVDIAMACQDLYSVWESRDCVAISKGIRQEHPLRAYRQFPQAVLPTGEGRPIVDDTRIL